MDGIKGRLMILVGIDGSGKSTQMSFLKNKGYNVAYWRDLKDVKLKKNLNFKDPSSEVQKLKNKERMEFILDYINAEKEYLIDPFIAIGINVISDGFYIRFYAKEKVYKKLNIANFEKKSPLSGNELIVMIDTPPNIAFSRKKIISPYECFYIPSQKNFFDFQKSIRKIMLEFIKEFDYIVIDGTLNEININLSIIKFLSKKGIFANKQK